MLHHSVCFTVQQLLFWNITVVKPACNKSIDESLCISLREKRTHLGNASQVVKSYFGHIPNV
jgi:hypothetical protein